MPSNQEFLSVVFGEDAPYAHVTAFPDDPSAIPADKHLIAWRGNWASRYTIPPGTNQYFTISVFKPDDRNIARRRKALFLRTRCIVLDDVREKLSIEAVQRLPKPSWVLETSPGSEQWGYILSTPCSDRGRVENLLDGLVANGLAPDGKDPGMKGVTRYARLPEGYNNKSSKLVDGQPFKCRMIEWNPFFTVTMEEMAAPFQVNLEAPRRESRVDGAADIPDHPLLQVPDLIHIKEARSNGRFDITCPWVDEHTGEIDDGTAIFTNQDGSMGFKCHHGACETRTGRHLLEWLEQEAPGFTLTYNTWQTRRTFADVSVEDNDNDNSELILLREIGNLSRMVPGTDKDQHAEKLLRVCEDCSALEQKRFHDDISHQMQWGKSDFAKLLKKLRTEWYKDSKKGHGFYATFLWVHSLNRFYDYKTNIFYTTDAFKNSFMDRDPEAVKTALQDGMVEKVHQLDFRPKMPLVFEDGGIVYGNTYIEEHVMQGVEGDIEPWFRHFDIMGVGEYKKHLLQWMAFTMRHPERKINHMLIFGGREGVGKDFLLTPLMRYMGRYAHVIDGHQLLSNFNEYLLGKKYIHINEVELFDHRDASTVSAKIKPLAAAPPFTLAVNQKNIAPINISNIVNLSMATNSRVPLRLDGASRRIFAVWSGLDIRDNSGQVKREWVEYFNELWGWMDNGGDKHVIHYLLSQVDLSDFNPGQAPPVTDFLSEIVESSKSPAEQALQYAIDHKIGLFKADILRAEDIAVAMNASHFYEEMGVYGVKTGWYTPVRVGILLNSMRGMVKVRGKRDKHEIRPWLIRNVDKYTQMTQHQIYVEYEKQLQNVRTATPFAVVKKG